MTQEEKRREAHRKFMERVKKMTPHEVFLSSVEAGIHNPDGTLTMEYGGEYTTEKK